MTSNISELPKVASRHDAGLPCQHENPRLWFSHLPAELNLAKLYCHGCPRRQPCLAGAVERAEPTGVWGGQIFDRGRIIDHKRPRGRPRKRTVWERTQMIHPVLLEQLRGRTRQGHDRHRREGNTPTAGPAGPTTAYFAGRPHTPGRARIDPQANVTTRPDHDRSGRDEDRPTPYRHQPNEPVLVMHGRSPNDPRHG